MRFAFALALVFTVTGSAKAVTPELASPTQTSAALHSEPLVQGVDNAGGAFAGGYGGFDGVAAGLVGGQANGTMLATMGTEDIATLRVSAGNAVPQSVVPEAANWALVIIGFSAVGTMARRRRHGQSVAA
jgi:hypothetical protein